MLRLLEGVYEGDEFSYTISRSRGVRTRDMVYKKSCLSYTPFKNRRPWDALLHSRYSQFQQVAFTDGLI
jgi:hypothetical protein